MYGYLKCFLPNMTKNEQLLMRRYYCSTCLAIKKNYGYFSTLILSYDLTIVPIVLDIYDQTICKHEKCHYTSRGGKLDSELWKPIGALNLAIAEQKIIDAISDEKSFFVKIGYKIAKGIIGKGLKKAKKDYPELFQKAQIGMEKVIIVEKSNCDITIQGETFADMIISSMECITKLNETQKSFIKGASIWLCFMDAIDDFDKDKSKNIYNPLLYTEDLKSKNKKELINNKYIEITQYCEKITNMLEVHSGKSSNPEINRAIDLYIYKILPYQTSKVLNRK